ncbi:MAG: GPW/gp25 family protein [Acidobacteriota bacterium]
MRRLADPPYLAFPFRVGDRGPELSDRSRHLREQIEQVLFTNPGERVFRPDFGAGIRTLIFEPNTSPLWTITRKRLIASLADALKGEVDPRSLTIDVAGEEEKVFVTIAYTLATLGHTEEQRFSVSA